MPTSYPESRRFLREILMYRYSQLLLKIEKQYPMTPEQKDRLYKRILNIGWIDSAFAADER
jgi:hypothetical protein